MTGQIKINTNHIGDDNDYSCLLYHAVLNLWLAGHTEQAYLIFNTDTMLVRQFTEKEFTDEMVRRNEAMQAQKVTDAETSKAYARMSD